MTDSTNLPSREAIIDRMAAARTERMCCDADCVECRAVAAATLDSLTLLDLAAEMQRRGAVINPSKTARTSGIEGMKLDIVVAFAIPAPQQEDTADANTTD